MSDSDDDCQLNSRHSALRKAVMELTDCQEMHNDKVKATSYKDLLVWQKGIELVKLIYKISQSFPSDEKFGLISQMRRAAVSVPSNLAEGQARKSTAEFVQFISHSEGSLAELDTQLIIAIELGYCAKNEAIQTVELISELRRMLNSLRRRLMSRT